jgi:hypothetical protein
MNPLRLFWKCLIPSARSIRGAAYSVFAFGLVATFAARSVQADMREVAFVAGHELGTLEDLTSGAYLIELNGAKFHRSSTRTSLSIKEVLDRYEGYCAASPSVLGRAMSDIPAALEERVELPKGDPLRKGIVREEARGRGMVACFVDENATSASLEQRVRSFLKDGDLADFGRFRYVFVEDSAHGRHVVTLWSDGTLPIGRMFPKAGDAPGTDSLLSGRPTASRRTFSASAAGFPAAVRIYETHASHDQVARDYDTSFAAKGFVRVENKGAVAYVGRDGSQVFVSLTTTKDGRTAATVVEAGRASIEALTVEEKR